MSTKKVQAMQSRIKELERENAELREVLSKLVADKNERIGSHLYLNSLTWKRAEVLVNKGGEGKFNMKIFDASGAQVGEIERPEPVEWGGSWWEPAEYRKPNEGEIYKRAKCNPRIYDCGFDPYWIMRLIPRASPEQLKAIGVRELFDHPVMCAGNATQTIWDGKDALYISDNERYKEHLGFYRWALVPVEKPICSDCTTPAILCPMANESKIKVKECYSKNMEMPMAKDVNCSGCAVENCEKEKPCPGCKYFVKKPVAKEPAHTSCRGCAKENTESPLGWCADYAECVNVFTGNPKMQNRKYVRKNYTPAPAPAPVLHGSLDYAISLQRAIEFHCKGSIVPEEIRQNCPHHAKMLDESFQVPAPAPKVEKEPAHTGYYDKLWDYMDEDHNVQLLNSDMDEICRIVHEMDKEKKPAHTNCFQGPRLDSVRKNWMAMVIRGANISKTLSHDAGAFARCSYCGRYSDNPFILNKMETRCDCGKAHGWSGSFKPPTKDSMWTLNEKEPAQEVRTSCEGCNWSINGQQDGRIRGSMTGRSRGGRANE